MDKQIEEMTEDIFMVRRKCVFSSEIAEALYKADYRKLGETVVELPCKVGDTVYRVKKRRGVWYILPREVVSLTYRLDHLHRVVWEIFSTETDVLGKSVFLTLTEAEEFVAKMKVGE
jgi:CO dehydrogenase/acetyl-CoA synthase beta subunit